jgi:hypothetical protein
MVDTIHRRFRVALTTDKTLIITETGPDLFYYRDFIADDKWDMLIGKDWEANIDKYKDEELLENFDRKSLQSMISIIRQIWNTYDDSQQEHIKKIIKRMLSYYVKYILETQK